MARTVLRIVRHTGGPLVGSAIVILVLGLHFATVPTAVAQTISGTVTSGCSGEEGCGLRGIQVTFLDSMNSLPLAETQTVVGGLYDSGNIPSGSYRIRFSDPNGLPDGGLFLPQFFGTGSDQFCAGTIVNVLAGSTVTADEDLRRTGPSLVVTYSGWVRGTVSDADTGVPLSGIQVSILRDSNALRVATATTDASGSYFFDLTLYGYSTFRVRFSDPSNRYFPKFYSNDGEAAAADDFCQGAITTLGDDKTYEIDEFLVRVPPEQLTQNLVEQVQTLSSGLPPNVSTMLGSSLAQAVNLLADANPSNDAAACGQLSAFISRVETQQKKGQLSSEEANTLTQSAEYIRTQLGCK
jgi:hypothetical protein